MGTIKAAYVCLKCEGENKEVELSDLLCQLLPCSCGNKPALDDCEGNGTKVICHFCGRESSFFDNYYIGYQEADRKAIKDWNDNINT